VLSFRKVLNLRAFDLSEWAATGLAVLFALTLYLSRRHYGRIAEILPRAADSTPSDPVDCMVVIPARNEHGNVGRAVRSLPPDTVIVVDDFSQDDTAGEARKAGAGVLPAFRLQEGGLGKANACMAGAKILTSRWILFADADTRFEPGFLEAAVSTAESNKLDFLSIYLRPEYRTLYESALSPFAVMLYFCGVDARSDPVGAFNGQCVLVRRDPYEFVGGHRVLLTSICDDVKMAELAQRHRLKFAVARAPRLGRVRIYPGDFERNAFRFALGGLARGLRIMLSAAVWALWLPAVVWLLAGRHWGGAVVFLSLPSVFLSPWSGWARAMLAPFGIYMLLPSLFRGAMCALMNRHVRWKGRVI
jgi:glycosyltransferase involved in cell wall biosynthesis